MPVGGTVELITLLGLDAASVRTAVSRLKKREWLVPETRAGTRGYALTMPALSALSAGDTVIWHARQPADLADGWCVVHFSVPESAGVSRHHLRSRLSSLGFGNIGTALWIAPARNRAAAEDAIAELGLTPFAAVFVGDYVAGQDLSEMLYGSWDLAAIDRAYRDFINVYDQQLVRFSGSRPVDPREVFITYLEVVDHWRKLPFRDPGLPRELLAEDWSAPEASARFERLVALLEGQALVYAASFWPRA
jgi:phenylacetic acid degradation operon negative regulatory protein